MGQSVAHDAERVRISSVDTRARRNCSLTKVKNKRMDAPPVAASNLPEWSVRQPLNRGRVRYENYGCLLRGRRLYCRSNFVFTTASIDGNASPKDKVWNRTDTGMRRFNRFLLDATARFRIKCDSASLIAVKTVVSCDVGQHISIGDIFGGDEISIGDGDCEPVLYITPGCCQNHSMSGLGWVGPELATKIQVKARSASLSLGASKSDLGICYAVARTQQVGNIQATCRRVRQQQDRMLPNFNG